MSRQLIFCVECKKQSKSDWMYIKKSIDKYLPSTKQIKFTVIYMGTKTKYQDQGIINKINKEIKNYQHLGDSIVIYCFDTDYYESNANHKKELKQEEAYCSGNGYEFVWFCHDIEEVYWGHSIQDSEKVKLALSFYKGNQIDSVDSSLLSVGKKSKGKSNLLSVLNKLWK